MLITSASVPPVPQKLLSTRAATGQSSAIRDLLDHAQRPGMISLAGGLPDASQFPCEQLAEIAASVVMGDGERILQYGATRGAEPARVALTTLFEGEVVADQVVVTTGSQQALDLIARVVIDAGDQVVVGDPDYLGALQVFRSHGAMLHPIAIDGDGMNTSHLEDELKWGLRPKCLYLVPNFHNPTGASLSAERRAHLAELSSRYAFLVIEDDPYRALYFDGSSPGELVADTELTVRLRSTSKTLAPGLRVGALAGPSWLTEPIVTAKQSADLHTSALTQALVAAALHADWLPAHVESLRSLYGRKRDALATALSEAFGAGVDFELSTGGMFLWVRFREIDDTSGWLGRCVERGVCFVPGAAFAVSRDLSDYARLSFATGSAEELVEAVARMMAAR